MRELYPVTFAEGSSIQRSGRSSQHRRTNDCFKPDSSTLRQCLKRSMVQL